MAPENEESYALYGEYMLPHRICPCLILYQLPPRNNGELADEIVKSSSGGKSGWISGVVYQ
jgi:hypothetical protein